tara:strand:+ start:6115 stop:7062 length:948 start_codon:yes stop_codon:yes gene_type:complete
MSITILPVWIAYAYFNYNTPNISVMNTAYPSAIAYYFITIQSNDSNYEYSGQFLNGSDVYQSTLTVYNVNGDVDKNYKVKNNKDSNKFLLNVKNTDKKLVIMRYYCNLNKYDVGDYVDNLPIVKDLETKKILSKADQNLRNNISEDILSPYFDNKMNQTIESTFSEFYYTNNSIRLFPDSTHFYLFARPGDGILFKISGSFIQNETYPYADFITIDGTGTKTENGIPFYDFPFDSNNNYTIYVAAPEISDDYIINYVGIDDIIILRWNSYENIGLIFRIATYSKVGISNFNKTMTPSETKEKMVSGFYPIFEKLL